HVSAASGHRVRDRKRLPLELKGAGDAGVEVWWIGSGASRRSNEAAGTHTGASRTRTGSARSRSTHACRGRSRTARRVLHHASVNALKEGAALGTQNVSIGYRQVVTRDRYIEIVGQRNRDCVVQRKHHLSVLHQLLQFGSVGKDRRFDIA